MKEQPLELPEETMQLEPEFERIYETVDQVEHDFPYSTQVRALTLKIDDAIEDIRSSLYQGNQA